MKLERVIIEDFKSIKKLNINVHNLTCFIGKNESGKSAILEAINYLNFPKQKLKIELTNKNSKRYEEDKFPSITAYFLLDEDYNSLLEETIPFEFDEKRNSKPNEFNFKWLRLTVAGDKFENIEIDLVHGNNKSFKISSRVSGPELNKLKNKIFDIIIPNIELFNNDGLTLNPITFDQLIQDQPLSESFRRLFAIGGIKNTTGINISNVEKLYDKLAVVSQKITELLQENYNQDKSLRVDVAYFSNQFLIKFKDDSNRSYSLNERSLGFQYFFAFLINKTYLSKIESKKNIFLLDEPGVSLHPEGARDLIKVFEEITKKDQLLYTTHNPFLAYRKKPDNLILVKRNGLNGTELLTKTYNNKYQVLRKELGLLLNDSFLVNDTNLIVEGNSDKYLLHYVIHEEEELEPLTWVHIFSADTVTDVVPSVRYLNSLGLKGFVLTDADQAAKLEIAKPKFKKHIIDEKKWTYCTLNKIIGDDQPRTMEDMLDPSKYVDAYNKYYSEEAETIDWKKPFEPYNPRKYNIPILNQLKNHFKDYADGEINKIALFRKHTLLYPYETNIENYNSLKSLLLFIHSEILKFN
jgi:predicted ATP-dependent endonuclease of OLD family